MTPDLEKIIPPMDEEGRALRIKAEHKLLNHVLKELDKDELEPSEFSDLMRSYCELKRRDNEREKITVTAAIAQLRESARAANRNHPARRLRLRGPQDSPFGVSNDDAWDQPSTSSTQSTLSTQLATADPTNSPSSIDNPETDPDVDPEWSLAPWGRRKNGKPRTEKEYRTILYRTVRDVYGLDLHDKPTPAAGVDQDPSIAHGASGAQLGLASEFRARGASECEPSNAPEAEPPQSRHATSCESEPRAPASDVRPERKRRSPMPPPRSPPGICGEPHFDPKPLNPWYYF